MFFLDPNRFSFDRMPRSTHEEKPSATVAVYALPAMESLLTEAIPSAAFTSVDPQVSLESQEVDLANRANATQKVADAIDDIRDEYPTTLKGTIVVVDEDDSEEENAAILHPMMAKMLTDPRHALFAIMPHAKRATSLEDLSSLSNLRATAAYLEAQGVSVAVGLKALKEHTQALETLIAPKPVYLTIVE